MKRLLTAAVGIPLALAAVFRLPDVWFFLLLVLLFEVGVLEYIRLGHRMAPGAPLWALLPTVPLAALAACRELFGGAAWALGNDVMMALAAVVPLGFGALVLASRVPPPAAVGGLGLLAFGLPYFALPIASLSQLQSRDPWLLVLMLGVVWAGDAAAFYLGSRWGRHRLAPVVSPNKSWEGSAAGLVASLAAAAAWSLWRLDRLDVALLALAAITAVAAQVGDLMESVLKRSAGVKDSGRAMPGHGGALDRLDALLFASPVWYLGLRLLGWL